MPARLATAQDLNWYIGYDGDLGEEMTKLFIKRGQIILFEEEGRPVGFLRLEFFMHKYPIVGEIQIYKDHRSKDLGAQMLLLAEDQLRAKGHKRLLCTSLADKQALRLWYESMGFKE